MSALCASFPMPLMVHMRLACMCVPLALCLTRISSTPFVCMAMCSLSFFHVLLNLHALQPIDMGTEVMFTCERSATCAQAAALVQAAQANLARYEPRTCAGPALKELTVRAEVHCPSMLHLLAFFPGSSYFHLCMPKLGEEEVACLAQTGGFARGTAKLVVGANTKLGSTFFSPSLWAAMPGLQTLRIYGKDALGVSLFKAAEGLAAVPRPVRVQFPNLAGLGWVQELHALVQTMAEGRGIVVEEY